MRYSAEEKEWKFKEIGWSVEMKGDVVKVNFEISSSSEKGERDKQK